jgi:hypothetical protein
MRCRISHASSVFRQSIRVSHPRAVKSSPSDDSLDHSSPLVDLSLGRHRNRCAWNGSVLPRKRRPDPFSPSPRLERLVHTVKRRPGPFSPDRFQQMRCQISHASSVFGSRFGFLNPAPSRALPPTTHSTTARWSTCRLVATAIAAPGTARSYREKKTRPLFSFRFPLPAFARTFFRTNDQPDHTLQLRVGQTGGMITIDVPRSLRLPTTNWTYLIRNGARVILGVVQRWGVEESTAAGTSDRTVLDVPQIEPGAYSLCTTAAGGIPNAGPLDPNQLRLRRSGPLRPLDPPAGVAAQAIRSRA